MSEKKAADVTVKAEQTFTVEQLRAKCVELFGVSDSTFAGATAGLTGRFTKSEMAARLSAWGKEVVR